VSQTSLLDPGQCEADAASVALRIWSEPTYRDPGCFCARLKSVLSKGGKSMQRFLICCAVGLGLLFGAFGPTPASAYYYHHHYYHHRHYYPYYHHRYYHHHYYRY